MEYYKSASGQSVIAVHKSGACCSITEELILDKPRLTIQFAKGTEALDESVGRPINEPEFLELFATAKDLFTHFFQR